ncbi:MAG: hypothetical protein CL805_02605 [Citromicrobium sp.]|nr:hypothetical protein [Citromicrobium sp.]
MPEWEEGNNLTFKDQTLLRFFSQGICMTLPTAYLPEPTAALLELDALTLLASVALSCSSLERKAISFQTTQWVALM